jgi:hypothetical protein
VNGVSVHSARFSVAVLYDPTIMDSISQQYREAGWQHNRQLQSHVGFVQRKLGPRRGILPQRRNPLRHPTLAPDFGVDPEFESTS